MVKAAAIALCAVALAGCNRFATEAQLGAISTRTAEVEQRVESLQRQVGAMANDLSERPSWVLWRQQIDTRPGVVYAEEPRWRAMSAPDGHPNSPTCGHLNSPTLATAR